MATFIGAPPVSRDGFTFINNEFFAEASNHNRHRRATPTELEAHFRSGSDKDKPAHWFEAQLIHYGLQPSKTKAAARMRLFDAVRDRKLSVPGHISELETDLKKEWTRADRYLKKGVAMPANGDTGGKPKAGDHVKAMPAAAKEAKPEPMTPPQATATDKSFSLFAALGLAARPSPATPASPLTTPTSPLGPLGLLNGNYTLTSDHVSYMWPWYDDPFSLTFTLVGTQLWGRFDIGVMEGVLFFAQRPFASSHDKMAFRWRGKENGEGEILYDQVGWMRFLGDGRVEGVFDNMSVPFEGRRDPGQGTRSEISVAQMRADWEDYSEDAHNRARVGRWR